jgi:uncharacterized protein
MPPTPPPLARHLAPRVREALADTPAVLIHGPRQCGKTTLARTVGEPRGYRYVTFDDDAVVAAALADPIGFVASLPARVILDEVQRVPGIFAALKASIDRRRTPGRLLLTGSANVLLVPQLADSLAGRLGTLQLHPLAQTERAGARPTFIDRLFARRLRTAAGFESLGPELTRRVADGGFPAALARGTPSRRRAWYRDYVDTQLQRDICDLSRLRSFDTIPRLLSVIAANTAQLINVAELAAPFELTRQTIHEHVSLLERIFLVDRLPPWCASQLRRAVKRPKLHIGDTGVACALLGLDSRQLDGDRAALGPLLETFVLQELRRQASAKSEPLGFFHFRDRDDFEVDIVLEQGRGRVAGIEVKAAASVRDSDFRGLRKLRQAAGARFVNGVVFYDGSAIVTVDESLAAVPIRLLWEGV